jgi:hypothetical protein
MPDRPFELQVGVMEHADAPEVGVSFSIQVDVLSFEPADAVHFAQLLVKNARLAGFTGEFTELPPTVSVLTH